MLRRASLRSLTRRWYGSETLSAGLQRSKHVMSASSSSTDVAILGGGLAGTHCASLLAAQGLSVTLYDMGRSGFGGRASTRRTEGFQFDHGCQFIFPTAKETVQLLQRMQKAGAARPWEGRFRVLDAQSGQARELDGSLQGFCGLNEHGLTPWVGVPGMSAVCKQLAAAPGIDSRPNFKVTRVEKLSGRGWRIAGIQRSNESNAVQEVRDEAGLLVLTDVMVALPDLPGSVHFECAGSSMLILERLRQPRKVPSFSLMAVLERPLKSLNFDAAIVEGSEVFKWVSKDSSKPGRQREDGQECWVAVTMPSFAEKLLSEGVRDAASLTLILQTKFLELLATASPGDVPHIAWASAQRWGSAFKSGNLSERSLFDTESGLAACGDFCLDSSAEGALLSAADAAHRLQEFAAKQ